jgi:hypothetical protein
MRRRPSKRNLPRAARTGAASILKIRSTTGSLRSDGRQGSSPLRGAPLVPRSASLTAVLAAAAVLLWGAGAPLFSTNEARVIAMKEENW